MMMFWIVALVISFGGLGARASKFNAEEHDALCNVLIAAVDLWNTEKRPESKLPSALKAAISQTIFGEESVGHVEDLYETLPDVYEHPGDREQWCGECGPRNHTDPYPGKSIPHDLMCLCTPGKNGVPFPSSSSWSWLLGWKRVTLCGKREWELIDEGHVGWYSLTYGSAVWDLRRPWNSVVSGCLKEASINTKATSKTIGEKLIILNDTLQFFKTKLVDDGYGQPKLGGHSDDREPSNGLSATKIHVRYRSCRTSNDGSHKRRPAGIRISHDAGSDQTPWWKKLGAALHDEKSIKPLIKTDDWFSWLWKRHSQNTGKFH